MTAEKRLNKQNEQSSIISALKTSSDEKVIAMLIDLKEQGELFYVETLLDMLTGNITKVLQKVVMEYISDIKIQGAAQIISNYISEKFPKFDVTSIVTVSWQSRLDFSQYLDPYFKVLIDGNYMAAIEAFTVIENALYSLTIDEATGYEELIKKSIPKADKDKQPLLLEMVNLLEEAKRAID
ncbi:MAG TPA: hypothetical protein DG754_12080 [Bacteroidales bacterium]|jgi:hypothetical protein|nr:hypothetical protein [Bacteroidales bacterium]